VKVITRNFQKKIPINPKRIREAILKVFSQEGLKKSGEITVSFVTGKAIAELNRRYSGRDEPTDVLTFDITGPKDKGLCADIIVSTEAAVRNARTFQTTPEYELFLYAVHGALHLCGYDDCTGRKRKRMHQKAIGILAKLEIRNEYDS
jgi:probable rRNA maturation factor